MDTVSVAARRDGLREKLDAALGGMHRAASAAVLKGDPLAEHLQALATSIDALAEIYETSADTQLDIADTLRTQADVVATEAVGKVHASGVAIIDQLAPRLASVVEKATRERLKALRLRTMLGGAAGLGAAAALIAGVAYSAGFASGRTQGEVSARTIAAAMAAGPAAARDWASLMADNDSVQALAACRKATETDSRGRRYCAMPVWLDPPPAPIHGE